MTFIWFAKLDMKSNEYIDIPMRPVLSIVNSPYHGLAQWLCSLLTPIKQDICRHTIRNNFDFIDQVRQIDLTHRMLSLDICSLFTNVPLEEAID